MGTDEHIETVERNIKVLQEKIKTLDTLVAPYAHLTIPKIQVNKSQLPFVAKGFSHDNFRKRIKGYLHAEYQEHKERKIIPMPGIKAAFCYDFARNEWWTKGPMHLIWGWKDYCAGNFDEVLKLVVDEDKQPFQDLVFGSVGKENQVITEPIILENGNTIIEKYYFLYHKGDYEKRSPVLLQGTSELIGIKK